MLSATPLICVVDDDESVRMSLEGLVRSLGYKVRVFASAEAYLESDVRNAAGCVVSDVQMPGGMDGIGLKETLARQGDPTPVILITAFADDHLRGKAERAGAACLLKKPFDANVLIDCLNSALAAGGNR